MKKMLVLTLFLAVLLAARLGEGYDVTGGEKGVLGLKLASLSGLTLSDAKGQAQPVSNLVKDKQVLVLAFVSDHCPWSLGRCGRLQSLSKRYAKQGVILACISANKNENLKEVIQVVGKKGLRVPIYRDQDQSVTRALRAQATPHMFIFDRGGVLRYSGAFDDSREAAGVKRTFCESALKDVLAGREVADPSPDFIIGCSIK